MKTANTHIILTAISALFITACVSNRNVVSYNDEVYDTGKPIKGGYSENDSVYYDSTAFYSPYNPYYNQYNYYPYPYLSYNYYYPYYYPNYYGYGYHWSYRHTYAYYRKPYGGNNYYGYRNNRNGFGGGNNYYGRRSSGRNYSWGRAHINPGSVRGGFGSTGGRGNNSSSS